tara:strand:- start:65 stop:793 length:729 start_codon:yes stop_codon:yes gene_type:complete
LIKLLIIGIIGGFLSGLLGVGGGVIFVPLLTYFINKDFKINTGVSSMAVIFVSIASSGTYIFNGFSFSVNIIYLIIGGIVGGFIGSKFTELINTLSLQRIFSILLFIVAIRMFYNTNFEATVNENPFLYLLIGIVAGVLSGLLGIGGGIVRIPLLIIFGGLENIVAQGFSLVGTIPTAITAAIVKLRNKPDLIKQGSLIGLFGILGSVIGGNIAFTISQNILNYIFAVFLLFVGVNLFFKKT